MTAKPHKLLLRLAVVSALLLFSLAAALVMGLSLGSTHAGLGAIVNTLMGRSPSDPMLQAIIWHIRFPRVLLAALVGAAMSAGGLVFQALLRNPLAEPYILGISGGSAIGAIIGIILGFSRFPGVTADGLCRQYVYADAGDDHLFGAEHPEKGLAPAGRRHGECLLFGGHHVSGLHDPGCAAA